jgi:hypothetical protein
MSPRRPVPQLLLALALVLAAACGRHQGAGTIEGPTLPPEVVKARHAGNDQILFGDLHVHTTFSADAFAFGLPIFQGEGASPVANACDFARYCSALDFWSITDHAEGLTPRRWHETVDAIRECNALAGDPENPDLVSFLGWEWTQIGTSPANHWGHKNVILRDLDDEHIPARPIHSDSFATTAMRQRPPLWMRLGMPLLDFPNRQIYWNLATFQEELLDTPRCPDGVDSRELPADCSEGAATPDLLFEKLAQWDVDAQVIPHGTTWGIYTPAGSTWDKQLQAGRHDPERQRLIEVYSGHGNSEEYRDWRAVRFDEDGTAHCPAPSDGYEPCCWRAGEIVRSRCGDAEPAECERRVEEARRNYLAAGTSGRLTLPGTDVAEWGDCGSCPDCFLPAFNYRPGSSVQYILSLGHPEEAEGLQSFRFGFIASSDNHRARPGTGYKEFGRLINTEAGGPRDADWYRRIMANADAPPAAESVPFDRSRTKLMRFQIMDFERQASFFLTGGLVAVHADGRSRDAIWQALDQRNVYGTSGDRILLWFDLLNGPSGPLPMGSETRLGEAPRFRARAVGALIQEPGCPKHALEALSPERLERLCRGECYNPSDRRRAIARFEVVRIRPREDAAEPTSSLIDDPWLRLDCPLDPAGCEVTFEDPDFVAGGRQALYYVRAIQEPTPAVNGGELRCRKRDENGICLEVNPCYGDYRTSAKDDCLAPVRERAWSSPIFVDFAAAAPGAPEPAAEEEPR